MKQRVIFVGVHNKTGLQPLASTTKSGKVVDVIIKDLGYGYTCVKSNLFDLEYFPNGIKPAKTGRAIDSWHDRTRYVPGDIIVCLGSFVSASFEYYFSRLTGKEHHKLIFVVHPSAVWGVGKRVVYIKNIIDLIKVKQR
jgi:hypothetical protein